MGPVPYPATARQLIRLLRVSAVLRCLGIPARVITNFNSAHDNTGNLKTDLIFHEDGTPDRAETRDSIWFVALALALAHS